MLLLALFAQSNHADFTVEIALFGGMSLARAIELDVRDRPQPRRNHVLLIIFRRDRHCAFPRHFHGCSFSLLPRFFNPMKTKTLEEEEEGREKVAERYL